MPPVNRLIIPCDALSHAARGVLGFSGLTSRFCIISQKHKFFSQNFRTGKLLGIFLSNQLILLAFAEVRKNVPKLFHFYDCVYHGFLRRFCACFESYRVVRSWLVDNFEIGSRQSSLTFNSPILVDLLGFCVAAITKIITRP